MEVPQTAGLIFNDRIRNVICKMFGYDYFIVKSIYFDKPPQSNWFVAMHQDLTISVDKKQHLPGFTNWTIKQNSFGVRPPLDYLDSIFTVRIHLDNTDGANGALKVLPATHKRGVIRKEPDNLFDLQPVTCAVKSGGIMLMRPLLMHASERTINNERRRVIHIEFSNKNLPAGLEWAEKQTILMMLPPF